VRAASGTATAASRQFDLLSLGTFAVLGLPDGMLGTAWPAMRHSFGVPVGALGLILLINTAGSVAVAAFVGRLIQWAGTAAVLAVAGSCAALGGIGYALAPGLWLVLSVGPLMGAAAGMTDGGLNTAVALTGRPRLLNLLHGFYGVGTAIGPLVVTGAIIAGSWRPAYLVLAALNVLTACCWIAWRREVPAIPASAVDAGSDAGSDAAADRPDSPGDPGDPAGTAQPIANWSGRRAAAVLTLGLVVFFLYTGLEVSAGQWEVSYVRGQLGLSASAAGLAAFGYWGALTAVRIGLALPAKPVPAHTVIGSGLLLAIVASGLIWWQPGTVAVVLAFVVLGAALAGVFPALIAVTPRRIGTERARHAIAWQVGAAAAGGSAISAVIGLLIDATSLAVLGPALVVLALLLFFANMALARLAPIREPAQHGAGPGRGRLPCLRFPRQRHVDGDLRVKTGFAGRRAPQVHRHHAGFDQLQAGGEGGYLVPRAEGDLQR
jgi:fucose permease